MVRFLSTQREVVPTLNVDAPTAKVLAQLLDPQAATGSSSLRKMVEAVEELGWSPSKIEALAEAGLRRLRGKGEVGADTVKRAIKGELKAQLLDDIVGSGVSAEDSVLAIRRLGERLNTADQGVLT